ncbi:hypothetical protein [Streptomyces cavernicola]|uniref:Uncharacterized protein n=1 Tax=Streptomyces cavernicola TaxID=3043613 RepID=A0ABT6SGS1_9ACTN|nr:hypothetical protein [Streptomyces sp. B-S-A6]MDI3407189.1 hypothetical protein [Streptomyces sp. B-S-A6]
MARHGDNSPNPRNPQGPSADERGVWDEALEPEQQSSLNASLRQVRDLPGASPELKDMAKKLLSGQVSIRDIVDDPSGARVFGGGDFAKLRGQWESASDEERDRLRNDEGAGDSGAGSDSRPGEGRPSRTEDERPKKGQGGRHSGGFSLY